MDTPPVLEGSLNILLEVMLYMSPKAIAMLAGGKRNLLNSIEHVYADPNYWTRRIKLYYPKYLPPIGSKAKPRLLYDVLQMLREDSFAGFIMAMIEISDYYTDKNLADLINYLAVTLPPPDEDIFLDYDLSFISERASVLAALQQAYPKLINWNDSRLVNIMVGKGQWDSINMLINLKLKTPYDCLVKAEANNNEPMFRYMLENYLDSLLKKESVEKYMSKAILIKSLASIKLLSNLNGSPHVEWVLGKAISASRLDVVIYVLSLQPAGYKVSYRLLVKSIPEQFTKSNPSMFKYLYPLRQNLESGSSLMKDAIYSNSADIVTYLFQQGVMYPVENLIKTKRTASPIVTVAILTAGDTVKDIKVIERYVKTAKLDEKQEAEIMARILDEKLALQYYETYTKRRGKRPDGVILATHSKIPAIVKLAIKHDKSVKLSAVFSELPPPAIIKIGMNMSSVNIKDIDKLYLDALNNDRADIVEVIIELPDFNPFINKKARRLEDIITSGKVNMLKTILKTSQLIPLNLAGDMLLLDADKHAMAIYDLLLSDVRFVKAASETLSLMISKDRLNVVEVTERYLKVPGIDINYNKGAALASAIYSINGGVRSYVLTQLLLANGADRSYISAKGRAELPPALQELLE